MSLVKMWFQKKNKVTVEEELVKVVERVSLLYDELKSVREELETFRNTVNRVLSEDREALNKLSKRVKGLIEEGR